MKKVFVVFLTLVLLSIGIYIFYINYNGLKKYLDISLNGEDVIILEYGNEYYDEGVTVKYKEKIIDEYEKISDVDYSKLGEYEIIYKIKYKKLEEELKRKVKIVDTTKPEITLIGEETISLIEGNQYNEPGVHAVDNYDGDISSLVSSTSNIDKDKPGTYEILYKVVDSSGNENSVTRKVIYNKKPVYEQGIAVLNYHFFYDGQKGEVCSEGICLDVKDFRKQLDYLKQNNFKTLTIEEFRKWMYGEIELPKKSVLLTIDDGAFGTSKINGNKLIPLLEEYDMHATLFLVTGWWNIENYRSPNLDIQSHSNDMHTRLSCGAQMLCSSYETVINDLKKSISITNSNTSFCFPFYAYDETSIRAVKEVGFKMAFVGGSVKAKRSSNKYMIPRYPIYKNTSLQSFINMVN